MEEILNSHSISFQSPEHHFFTSAIVTGILPIAVGTALALKYKQSSKMVFCFIGGMTAESGVFYECLKYSIRNQLPIHFIIEDNGLSTNTPTQEVWGNEENLVIFNEEDLLYKKYITKYSYVRGKYPHVGIGKFIYF
jgi:pyruvate dehydrogenase E1 component alpha subunit